MNQTAKLFTLGSICFLLGAGVLYAWSSWTELKQENGSLSAQLQASPEVLQPSTMPDQKGSSSALQPAATPSQKASGEISGTLGYPSESIPQLEIYALKQDDHSTFYTVSTQQNQSTFTIEDVVPGIYVLVAYPVSIPNLVGGYTKAVPCGLTVACTDHSLLPVVVVAGELTQNVEITDWYVPEGTFPAKPN